MCTSARRPTVRSAIAKTRWSRNGLNPCFVLTSTGTRASVPATRPWKSACTRCVWRISGRFARTIRSSRANARGLAARPSRSRSTGTPEASSRDAKSAAPGSPSWSITSSTSYPRSRSAGRSNSRWFSEPEIPATFATWSARVLTPRARRPGRPMSRRSARGSRSRATTGRSRLDRRPTARRSRAPARRRLRA